MLEGGNVGKKGKEKVEACGKFETRKNNENMDKFMTIYVEVYKKEGSKGSFHKI